MYRSARMMCFRAHGLDPNDALITRAILEYLTPELRKQTLGSFMREHPWVDEDYEQDIQTISAVQKQMGDHKAYELHGTPRPVTLRLVNQYGDRDSNHPVGVGVEMRIQNRKTLRLLLDTGAREF